MEVGGGLDLLQESLGADEACDFRTEHFDSDLPVVPHIMGEKDRRHGAGAQLAIEHVPAGKGALETVECGVHG